MNQTFYQELQKEIPELMIILDEPMKKHTTFRIGGAAEFFVKPKEEQLSRVLAIAHRNDIPVTVIGNGSNLLVSDNGIKGLVIEISQAMSDIRVDGTRLYAQAGALLSKVAATAAANALSGLEFAAGIPGSVGGAVVMNAGAYDGEMKDVLVWVRVLTQDGEIRTIPALDMDLSYRHSCVLKNNYIVLGAEFALEQKAEEEICRKMDDFRARRIAKQPLEYPSAGSTFKRPKGYFAGKLIMDAGLRGYRVGDAQVSTKHCGFVINCGNATASDVMQLIDDVRDKVFEEFQVQLEPEIKMIGDR